MKFKNIKYVIGTAGEFWRVCKCYNTPFGKLHLTSFNMNYYVGGKEYDKPLFINSRKLARLAKQEDLYRGENIYQVEVDSNNEIIKWIKKNP